MEGSQSHVMGIKLSAQTVVPRESYATRASAKTPAEVGQAYIYTIGNALTICSASY